MSHLFPGPDEPNNENKVYDLTSGSELGDKALITSAKALANTAYRLITEEGLLEKVKEEFREAQRNQG